RADVVVPTTGHGPAWTVFVGNGCAEQGHHPVAGVLIDRALEAVHLRCDAFEAAVDDLVHELSRAARVQKRERRDEGRSRCPERVAPPPDAASPALAGPPPRRRAYRVPDPEGSGRPSSAMVTPLVLVAYEVGPALGAAL